MISENKSDFWQRHIEGWRQSKLSQKAYCTEQDLSFASFGYSRTRLNRKIEAGGKFIPVNFPKGSSSIIVFLLAGLRLGMPAHALANGKEPYYFFTIFLKSFPRPLTLRSKHFYLGM